MGTSQIPFGNLSLRWIYFLIFDNFPLHGNLGNFSRELGNFPDIWEFGELPCEMSQEKEFGNFPNSLRESEVGIFFKFRKIPSTWEFGESPPRPWELPRCLGIWGIPLENVPSFQFCHFCIVLYSLPSRKIEISSLRCANLSSQPPLVIDFVILAIFFPKKIA